MNLTDEIQEWVNAFRSEFLKQNLVVKDITLAGDVFRFLIQAEDVHGSSGVEAFIQKNSDHLTYQATIIQVEIKYNNFALFLTLEQERVKNEIEQLLFGKSIDFEFLDNGVDFGVTLRKNVGLDYQDSLELELAYDSVCVLADVILSYKNTRFPVTDHS